MPRRHSRLIMVATITMLIGATLLTAPAAAAGRLDRERGPVTFARRSIELGGDVAMRLPGERAAPRAGGRGALYRAEGYTLRASTDEGWTTTLIDIPGPEAPTRYAFTFDLPRGWALEAQQDGSVAIVDRAGERAGTIAPPWARDAEGEHVPTRYAIRGRRRLVQTVSHEGAAYPVVADPSVTLGRNVYFWVRGYEIGWWGSASAGFLSTYLCAVYGSLHPVLCAVGAAGASWLIRAFHDVFSGDRCRYVIAVRYWGWPNYMERLRRHGCTYRKSEIPG